MTRIRDTVRESALSVGSQVIIVVAAFAVATLLLLVTGYDPAAAARGIWRGVADVGGLVRWSIPLILAGLAVSTAFRTGMFNLGVDGQLYLGAVAATAFGLSMADTSIPGFLLIFGAFVAGITAGALWSAIPALLRLVWNTNEVVTTLMLNFIALYFTDYLVLGPLRGTGATGTTYSSDNIPESMWLDTIIPGSKATTALFLCIILAVVLAFVFRRTTLGYEFKVVGTSPNLAKYGGVPWQRILFLSMLMSGAIAGMAGVVEILGVHYRFPGRFNPGLGFNGIVVSLIAAHNPIGVIFSGLFFGALRNGARYMERLVDVPRAMVEIVEGLIILAVAARITILRWRKK
jgi:general nucleoside transport system permease protein